MQDFAVFTGDIVNSTALEAQALDRVFEALADGAAQIGGWPGAAHVPLARFRGDGWQAALPPRYALRAALVLRARVRATGKGHETRIGLALGPGHMPNDTLAAAEGPVFVASGHALDTMKRRNHFAAPDAPAKLRIALPLADLIAQGWTQKQAEVVAALLDPAPPTQNALAETLDRSRQALQKQAEAAGLPALIDACAVFEDTR